MNKELKSIYVNNNKDKQKSQIVIPKEIREILRISEGNELIVDVEGDRVFGYYIRMPGKV